MEAHLAVASGEWRANAMDCQTVAFQCENFCFYAEYEKFKKAPMENVSAILFDSRTVLTAFCLVIEGGIKCTAS